MAGFLDKKKRLIDYKLTEHGRRQLSTGDIRFKYYTFSDKSIVYSQEKSSIDGKISDSEFYYLPYEVSTDPGMYYNPEFYLSNEVSTFNPEDYKIYSINNNISQKTLAQNFSKSNYISTKRLANKNVSSEKIVFDNLYTPNEFDFVDQTFTRKYPTILYFKENVDNLVNVKNDYRFIDYLKFKKLNPVNSENENMLQSEIISSNTLLETPRNPINYIFKTLDLKNEISLEDNRDEVISKVVSLLSKNKKKLFYLEYELNKSYLKSNDQFTFELHKIKSNNIDKLPFINLGKIYDRFNQRYINVFLIGKFIKKELRDESINIENITTIIDISNDYYFVNLFTLVVE
tara:strand:+ start:1395 stop:2429 length:1035 start_codon:yes stop_codon:yes gene_type:complete